MTDSTSLTILRTGNLTIEVTCPRTHNWQKKLKPGWSDCQALCLKRIPYWHEELTHWKRPWCWEKLKAEGEGDDRGWDGWMALPTQLTWVWVGSGSWWWTGKPGVLQSMGSQRVGHDWATELNWININLTEWKEQAFSKSVFFALLSWFFPHQFPLFTQLHLVLCVKSMWHPVGLQTLDLIIVLTTSKRLQLHVPGGQPVTH